MRIFKIKIMADRYPTEYTVQASSWGTAINRAVKQWQKRFKGSHAEELKISAIKGGQIIKQIK
jgi:hypothetical protein